MRFFHKLGIAMSKVTPKKQKQNRTFKKQSAAWRCDSIGLVKFEGHRISSSISFFKFPKDIGSEKDMV